MPNYSDQWEEEIQLIDAVLQSTEMTPTTKWGTKVYTLKEKNVVACFGFKNHFGLWFYHGVYLSDPKHLLVNAQKGKTKAMRHLKFTSKEEIDLDVIRLYVAEAIQLIKDGKFWKKEVKSEAIKSSLLQKTLDENSELKAAFEKLTPYKQKEYHEHINSAKRESTQLKRLEKITSLILDIKGLNDKYR
ncbi:MAG: YdeI/OmpD-associated family protein [Bacteroidota bacterium]